MRSVPWINLLGKGLGALFFLFLIPQSLLSQPTGPQLKKLSLALQKKWNEKRDEEYSVFIVAVQNSPSFKNKIDSISHVKIIYKYSNANVFLIRITWSEIINTILHRDKVIFVDEHRTTKSE